MMWLIIDDERRLGCDIVARTPTAGKAVLLAMNGQIECLCIDHDLGTDETGLDVVKWALGNGCLPVHVQIVSQNPIGAQNIRGVLRFDGGYSSADNINFIK